VWEFNCSAAAVAATSAAAAAAHGVGFQTCTVAVYKLPFS
jgi:hypothetical protein